MKHFKQTILGGRLNGHEEIIPINNDNQEEYIKELVSLPYLNEDVKRIMLFLSNRIKELE